MFSESEQNVFIYFFNFCEKKISKILDDIFMNIFLVNMTNAVNFRYIPTSIFCLSTER